MKIIGKNCHAGKDGLWMQNLTLSVWTLGLPTLGPENLGTQGTSWL